MTDTHTLRTADGTLYYEVRGEGPVLVLTGAPMGAEEFTPLADLLARDRTVLTHDPRGISRSPLDDPESDSTPELRADDLVALLDAVGADRADVLGSSGGAVTSLALAERHPGRVRTVVAHEPPLLSLLPDAAEQHAVTEEIIETYRREGVFAAWARFMANAGFPVEEAGDHAPSEEPGEQMLADSRRFYLHEIRATTRHVPGTDALRAGPARVVVGAGAASGPLLTHRTSLALAERLGTEPVTFPGGHGGFAEDPEGFAAVLRRVLGGD
ncbi:MULTISPECIES: alpha/beta fold hydrolase [unclassified Nocardiopsis]|uniref:alpha/beta fold hydrolase n=1 Tax=unclassified Nocardiopsis TaxID=2649073 RepID=UPI00135AB132|nr:MULTISPECIES: alpha/beta hydrolase [unclassified Nocardiopsis]